MNTTPATTKQLDYLLALINQAEGTSVRFISQTKFSKANLNMRQRSGGITKPEASAMIDRLVKASAR